MMSKLLLGLLALLLGSPAPGSAARGPGRGRAAGCKTRCYQQKSFDYQRCRMIPPGQREERNACFIRADSALDRCLRGC
jgi:hypothetical protein